MKRLLLATAAVIALAVAAPIAAAQYTTPPPAAAPYTTPVPDDPMTPQDESLAAQPDTTATQSQSQLTTPGTPETSDPLPSTTAQTQSGVDSTLQAQTQTGVYGPPQPGASVQAETASPQYQPYSVETQTASTYNSQTTTADATSGMGENVATPASLEQHARDAGMNSLPMTAQAVCMPRQVSLTTRGAFLNRDKEHQLINAADRASVCEFQRVVISSPNGRVEEARQLLISHGVDAALIEVVDTDAPGLEVEMQFAGIATSNEQYAQMFNVQQYASYQPTAQGYSPNPAAPGSTYQPNPEPGSTYAPSTTAPAYDPSMQTQDPDAEPVDEMDEDGMSPTSGEPAVTPDLLDI